MKNNIFKNYLFMLKIIQAASPSRIGLTILMTTISNFFQIFYNVLFFAYFMECVSEGRSMLHIISVLLVVVVLNIIFELLNAIYNDIYVPKDNVKLSVYIKKAIYKKILTVDIECFDNPQYYDEVTFVLQDVFERSISILNTISSFISHLFCTGVLIAFFTKVDSMIVVMSLISVSLGFIFGPKQNKFRYKYNLEIIPANRKLDYLRRVLIQSQYSQELRTTNVKNVLGKILSNTFDELKNILNKYFKKITIWGSIEVFLGFGIVSLVATVISLYKIVVTHTVTIASFLPLLGALAEFMWRASSVVETYNEILNSNLYLDKFNKFSHYEPKVVSTANDKVSSNFKSLKIENLSFKYSENGSYILKNINLEIRSKQKIAIVGYNGAGKSTLINLILRLYDPTNGNICYNNKDIKDININDYRNKYGVLFQDINIYATSLSKNIAMNTKVPTHQELDDVTKRINLNEKINTFNNGYETQLTHEFSEEGVILSGGQSQSLALARLFMNKQAECYILDEPTSALDPLTEAQIFESIYQYASDKTVIFISHRFSSSKIADKIYFLENGEIAEEGTHKELMELNGKYANMYNMQAQHYKPNITYSIK